jgi:predicted N-acetyltransferase YhbS
MTLVVRPETANDLAIVERIVAEAFGPGRYAKSAYRLREGVKPIASLSLVAVMDDTVVGTVRFWPVSVGRVPAIMLGPIAVKRDMQGKGIALKLMQDGLDAARRQGFQAVILVGDEPYYARVGFARIMPAGRVTMPGPVDLSRVLGLALVEGALDQLTGEVCKPSLDEDIVAHGAKLSSLATPSKHQATHNQQ